MLSGLRGELSADDRGYLAEMVSARTGLPPADALARVATVEHDARAAADTARHVAMQLAFWTVAALFLGAPRRQSRRHGRRGAARRSQTPDRSLTEGETHWPFHLALAGRRADPYHHPAGAVLALMLPTDQISYPQLAQASTGAGCLRSPDNSSDHFIGSADWLLDID
jgi:hypothetical protein